MKVAIEFAQRTTYIPDKMLVRLGTTDRVKEKGKSYPKTEYNAVRLDEKCPGSHFVFPDLFLELEKQQVTEKLTKLVELVFSYGFKTSVVIERHEAVVWRDFQETTVTLNGLKGITRTAVKFSPKLKKFP